MCNFGFPITIFDLRCIVKMYLEKKVVIVNQFENNIPGKTWADMFLKRHKQELSQRFCSNITRVRAAVDEETIQSFLTHFKKEMEGVPAHLIYKYDETNLVDDPGKKKVLMKRGCEYPEAIKNSTKAAVNIMICGNAAGDVLPPYVNYKSEHLWTTWTEGRPAHTRYNRSHSGDFVAVEYEGESWPERVKSTKNDGAYANCMERCGLSWKWPDKENSILRRFTNILVYLASEDDNAGDMSPGSSTESYPALAHIGLRENPGKPSTRSHIFLSTIMVLAFPQASYSFYSCSFVLYDDDNNALSESVKRISYKICHEIAKELKTFNEAITCERDDVDINIVRTRKKVIRDALARLRDVLTRQQRLTCIGQST
ncbi:hypothetical protein ANN_21491 [Periplaneta americana]|uniref:Uncharacterized protein n=1 Tax=Periplaneta americana TaxID=6978 RepID=A0ABQ8SFF3_PERAM|nr:hypothetical protein ANN_21491 [Periplaneta americana]